MVRVGIVGLGAWGWNVARSFRELRDCEVVACCDVDPKRAAAATKTWPSVSAASNLTEMLQKQSIDAVVISSPATTHFTLAEQVLQAGKDVFIEKPFTLNIKEAEELAELAEEKKAVLMVGHLMEYHPAVQHLKGMIEDGELGEVYYIYTQRVNLGRIRGDENALWSFAPHDLSQIMYILGIEPTDVSARGQSFIQDGIEDVVFLSLYFENRIMAHIHLSWLDPHKIRRTTIVGSKKMAVFDDTEASEKLRIYNNHAEVPAIRSYGDSIQVRFGDILIPRVDTSEPLKLECQHFVDCVRTRANPRSDAEDGLRVIRILEAAQRSMEQDGVPVKIKENENGAIHPFVGSIRSWHAIRA
jgi:predicted dehydrogenase